jgi:hypothetical protein
MDRTMPAMIHSVQISKSPVMLSLSEKVKRDEASSSLAVRRFETTAVLRFLV